MVIGTNIMLGTIPIGGMTITPAGSTGIIPNGPRPTMTGAAPTAIGMTIMHGTTALGGTTTGDIAFQPGGQAAGASLYLASNGNVGIGTLSPLAALDVRGNTATTPAASFSANTTNAIN